MGSITITIERDILYRSLSLYYQCATSSNLGADYVYYMDTSIVCVCLSLFKYRIDNSILGLISSPGLVGWGLFNFYPEILYLTRM